MKQESHDFSRVECQHKLVTENTPGIEYIKEYAGAEELLKGKKRYCIWLKDVSRSDILRSSFLTNRIKQCREFRLGSKRGATNKLADTPELFGEIRQPESGYIIVCPKVSSKHRDYIPMLYVNSKDYIINGSALMIPNGTLYEFGILSSNVHNAWLKTIAETWGHSYQYSTDIYSSFPFPEASEVQVKSISDTAKEILKIREKHSDLTIADMYSPKVGILSDLLKVHRENDIAVMKAYGMPIKETTAESCVATLMELYKEKAGVSCANTAN